jgi:hypothetical protein
MEVAATGGGCSNDNYPVRRMSVGQSTLVPEWVVLPKQDSLRTLIITNCKINFEPNDSSLTGFSRLRVLSIQGGDCDRLVGSLCQLRHLRYLCLDETNLSELPDDIQKMKFLQHILLRWSRNHYTQDMYGSNDNIVIPKGFHQLINLRTLKGFPVHMDMDGHGTWCSLEEIGSLSQLTHHTLHGLEKLAASSLAEMTTIISSKQHLDYLELHWSSSGCVGSRDVGAEAGPRPPGPWPGAWPSKSAAVARSAKTYDPKATSHMGFTCAERSWMENGWKMDGCGDRAVLVSDG